MSNHVAYRVIAPLGVTFNPGTILTDLDGDQARRRIHLLEKIKGGKKAHKPGDHYMVRQRVAFKLGEEFTLVDAGPVNKATLQGLGVVEPDQDPGDQDPGNQDPGDQDPGDQDPGDQDPGDQDPGNQDPGDQDPGDQDPGDQDPGDQDPGDQNKES